MYGVGIETAINVGPGSLLNKFQPKHRGLIVDT